MPTPDQLTRLAHVRGWIRTAKEALPAINHGRNAVAAEQIARLSALLDRMHCRSQVIQDALDAGVDPSTTLPATSTVASQDTPAPAQGATNTTERHGRRAA